MCLADTPDFKQPDPVQDKKEPDLTAFARARKKNATMQGGTLLTSPSGVASGALSTGAPTLLGG